MSKKLIDTMLIKNLMKRIVMNILQSRQTLEGAGMRLNRVFGYHQEPLFDPFLLLDHFGSRNPEDYIKGFPSQSHRGIETVTFMLTGEVEHGDSIGNTGVINPGDLQWMTAGSGIIHQEMLLYNPYPVSKSSVSREIKRANGPPSIIL